MTNQLQGEILFAGWGASPAVWAYTPWMPVRGDRGTFGVQITGGHSSPTLTWNVETREAEDDATVVDLFASNQTGAVVVTNTAPKLALQWVRYRFSAGDTVGTGSVIFRALQPSWLVDR